MASNKYIPRMRSLYTSNLRDQLMKDLKISNTMLVPKIDKIVLNMGLGNAKLNKNSLKQAEEEMGLISGQKAVVTYAKKGDTHNRRLIQKKLPGKLGKNIASILIHDIAPEYENRSGGYTRIIKLNNRKNDNAPVSLIEFVDLSNIAEVVEEETEKE